MLSYFCKECCERHQVGSKLYKEHEQYAFKNESGQMPDTVLIRIFRLNKILDDEDLFRKLVK